MDTQNIFLNINEKSLILQYLHSSSEGWIHVPLVSLQFHCFSINLWITCWSISILWALLLAIMNHETNHKMARGSTSGVDTLRKSVSLFWSSQILERIKLRWRDYRTLYTPVENKNTFFSVHSTRIVSVWYKLSISQRKTTNVWITVFFMFILFSNIFGLVPFFEAITGKAGVTLGLSFALWAAVTYSGIYRQGVKFVKLFLPSGPSWPMAPIFVLLEFISYCFRALSLGVRLWANMLAGHQLIHLVTGIALVPALCLQIIGIPVTLLAAGLRMALTGLESIVCVLQSGVFCLLASFYLHEVLSKKESVYSNCGILNSGNI